MSIEQERAELLPCPFCGGSVSFHQDDEECGEGCHYIECKTCGMFDLSTAADPANTVEDLGELRARITPLWNRRAALQSQDREDAERYRWLRENWFTMGSTYKDDQIQFYINGPRYSNATEADLDAAIDHARRAEGEGE